MRFRPSDPRAVAAGRRGGLRSGEARLRRVMARLAARIRAGDVAGAVALLRGERWRGYQAGHIAGRRLGWAQALGERDSRTA
jgi:hypothetical protein